MSVFATLKKTASSVAKFMGRYADETSSIADALRLMLPALPIGAQDKRRVADTIEKLDNAADNISAFLKSNPKVGEPVTVRASDVQKAVADYLAANPAVLEKAVAAEIDKRNTAAILGNA